MPTSSFIYFAGHGLVRTVGKKEEGYLLPHDADPTNPVLRGVAMSDLARWVEALEAEAGRRLPRLLLFRAGGDHPLRRSRREVSAAPTAVQELAGKGRFVMTACAEGQKSLEDPDLRHGLFTYHLLKGIEGEGDSDGDGRVGVTELFEYVSKAVEQRRPQAPLRTETLDRRGNGRRGVHLTSAGGADPPAPGTRPIVARTTRSPPRSRRSESRWTGPTKRPC